MLLDERVCAGDGHALTVPVTRLHSAGDALAFHRDALAFHRDALAFHRGVVTFLVEP